MSELDKKAKYCKQYAMVYFVLSIIIAVLYFLAEKQFLFGNILGAILFIGCYIGCGKKEQYGAICGIVGSIMLFISFDLINILLGIFLLINCIEFYKALNQMSNNSNNSNNSTIQENYNKNFNIQDETINNYNVTDITNKSTEILNSESDKIRNKQEDIKASKKEKTQLVIMIILAIVLVVIIFFVTKIFIGEFDSKTDSKQEINKTDTSSEVDSVVQKAVNARAKHVIDGAKEEVALIALQKVTEINDIKYKNGNINSNINIGDEVSKYFKDGITGENYYVQSTGRNIIIYSSSDKTEKLAEGYVSDKGVINWN